MALVDQLSGASRVALDTVAIIYFVEEHPVFGAMVDPLFRLISSGQILAYGSVISLLEVLTAPLRNGQTGLARRYRRMLMETRGLVLLPLHSDLAERAAQLRATYNLRTADAIVVATAVEAGCSHLVTNDRQVRSVAELEVLLVGDFAQ